MKARHWLTWSSIGVLSAVVIALPTIINGGQKFYDLLNLPPRVSVIESQVIEIHQQLAQMNGREDEINREWLKVPRQSVDIPITNGYCWDMRSMVKTNLP